MKITQKNRLQATRCSRQYSAALRTAAAQSVGGNKTKMKKYEPIEQYVNSVYNVSTDIKIWQSIIGRIVYEYESEGLEERDLFSSIFTIYDIDKSSGNGLLKVFQNNNVRITTKNLRKQKESFFRWIINSSILKIYNSVEILLQSVISEEFLNKDSENFGKKELKLINKEIRDCFQNENLGKYDTRNNRHLIQYLKFKSSSVEEFMKNKVRIDLQSNWEEFFELISILRNVVAHNGMLIEKDTLNNIRNSARDVFERYFSTELKVDELTILNPNQQQVLNLINMINEFAVNMVKFMKNESNRQFSGFK